jgi:hypothetical protein
MSRQLCKCGETFVNSANLMLHIHQADGTEHGVALQPKLDPRDPDYSRDGIFQTHNCWMCDHGRLKCVNGSYAQCSYPRARND